MKKVCILLVLITYHNARFKKRNIYIYIYIYMSTFLSNLHSTSHTIVLLVVTDSNLIFKHPFKTEDDHSGNLFINE